MENRNFSSLRGRRPRRRRVLASISGMGMRRLLELDTILLLTGRRLGTKVAVVLRVGGILGWWWLLAVVAFISAVGLLVLVGGWVSGGRGHPRCTGVGAETVVAAAAGVEASVGRGDVSTYDLED
jgi:uncharacterized membrane protein